MRGQEIIWYTPEEKMPEQYQIVFYTKLSDFAHIGTLSDGEFFDYEYFYDTEDIIEWAYI